MHNRTQKDLHESVVSRKLIKGKFSQAMNKHKRLTQTCRTKAKKLARSGISAKFSQCKKAGGSKNDATFDSNRILFQWI